LERRIIMHARVSVLFPTRRRPELAKRAISSLYNSLGEFKDIEIIIACDNDDTNSRDEIMSFTANTFPDLKIGCLTCERMGYGKINEYFNLMIPLTSPNSEMILFWGDDYIMKTEDWTTILYNHYKKSFGVYFLLVKRGGKILPNPTSFALPKKWFNVVGSLGNPIDSWLAEVGKRAGCYYKLNDLLVIEERMSLSDETQRDTEIAKKAWGKDWKSRSSCKINIDVEMIRDYMLFLESNSNQDK